MNNRQCKETANNSSETTRKTNRLCDELNKKI